MKHSQVGAIYLGGARTQFSVWAPAASRVELHLTHPQERIIPMQAQPRGYFEAVVDTVEPGARYLYRLDSDKERPDPASRFQPEGVHGPSEIIQTDFPWQSNAWPGLRLEEYIIYELHTGTYTPDGTFEAIIPHLPELVELGITAIELMPIAQFPGSRNWGYDGVYPFAAQNSYGGPRGLRKLVDACHGHKLAVILDVVYNHLGPEGNYVADFGPYFTDRYKTPWGRALNFDGEHSDEVRSFFIQNAVYWITDFRIDALRLDAIHAIVDQSASPFLQELAAAIHERAGELNRRIYAIPESALNDSRILRSPELGGYGLDAQWNDDFHHALRTAITEERSGYYQDYGEFRHLVKAFGEGYVYSGQYSSYRRRRFGNSAGSLSGRQLVVFSQNHDQVGNRLLGDRLTSLVCFERLKLAAGAVLLSPFVPLLFMGEEYGETAPFQYFISHSDAELIEAVRRGRRQEFQAFAGKGDIPDPQDEAAFLRSKLNPGLKSGGRHRALFDFYKELIGLRCKIPALRTPSRQNTAVSACEERKLLVVQRQADQQEVVIAYNFGDTPAEIQVRGKEIFASSSGPARQGMLNPYSFVVLLRGD